MNETPDLTLDTRVKWLTTEAHGPSSHFDWTPYLPTAEGRPGQSLHVAGTLRRCENGIHTGALRQWRQWRDARLFVVDELSTDFGEDGNKRWVREARLAAEVPTWNECALRLFAADCAERVLPLFETRWPNDNRPRRTIEAVRRYARGEIDWHALAAAVAAAHAAAYAAAADNDAADAAYAAASAAYADAAAAAYAAAAAASAAYAAAYAAAAHAAYAAAADDAAYAAAAAAAAEREWQDVRLLAYLRGEITP